jgi:hypothetical protein
VIRNAPTNRVAKPNSTPELKTVGQGKHPSAKSDPTFRCTLSHDARSGLGPGVRVSGAAPRRQESDRHGMTVVAVRHGTDPVAVPL